MSLVNQYASLLIKLTIINLQIGIKNPDKDLVKTLALIETLKEAQHLLEQGKKINDATLLIYNSL